MKVLNPATNAVIADVAEDAAAAVKNKYLRARAAQPAWAATPIRKRLDAIRAFRERITAMRETLARTLTQEVGKPIKQSRNELDGLLVRIDFFLAEAVGALREEKVHTDASHKLEERISHEPLADRCSRPVGLRRPRTQVLGSNRGARILGNFRNHGASGGIRYLHAGLLA